jgi:hypothetical protein
VVLPEGALICGGGAAQDEHFGDAALVVEQALLRGGFVARVQLVKRDLNGDLGAPPGVLAQPGQRRRLVLVRRHRRYRARRGGAIGERVGIELRVRSRVDERLGHLRLPCLEERRLEARHARRVQPQRRCGQVEPLAFFDGDFTAFERLGEESLVESLERTEAHAARVVRPGQRGCYLEWRPFPWLRIQRFIGRLGRRASRHLGLGYRTGLLERCSQKFFRQRRRNGLPDLPPNRRLESSP